MPLPTVIADSCLTVNGAPTHMLFVSPTQVNAQMPAQASGNVAMVMHTPGGVSNTYFLTLLTGAPSVFLMTLDGVDPMCRRSSAGITGWWSPPPIPCTAAIFSRSI